MLLIGIMAPLALLGAPAEPAVTAPATCALLQVAYATVLGKSGAVYPSKTAAARQKAGPIRTFAPEYRDRLELTPRELEDLGSRQVTSDPDSFIPECAWKGEAVSWASSEDEVASFSRPLLSSDGRLALVEVSFSYGLSARGELCILRHGSGGWRGRCLGAWSIR